MYLWTSHITLLAGLEVYSELLLTLGGGETVSFHRSRRCLFG